MCIDQVLTGTATITTVFNSLGKQYGQHITVINSTNGEKSLENNDFLLLHLWVRLSVKTKPQQIFSLQWVICYTHCAKLKDPERCIWVSLHIKLVSFFPLFFKADKNTEYLVYVRSMCLYALLISTMPIICMYMTKTTYLRKLVVFLWSLLKSTN